MVFELCNLVCRGVAEHAEQNAAALRGGLAELDLQGAGAAEDEPLGVFGQRLAAELGEDILGGVRRR